MKGMIGNGMGGMGAGGMGTRNEKNTHEKEENRNNEGYISVTQLDPDLENVGGAQIIFE